MEIQLLEEVGLDNLVQTPSDTKGFKQATDLIEMVLRILCVFHYLPQILFFRSYIVVGSSFSKSC